MGISSLVLGILALIISLSIFKDLSLILAILAIIFGVISLTRKQNKGMSIAGIITAVLGLILLFSNTSDTSVISSSNLNSTNNSYLENSSQLSKDDSKKIKEYGLNEEITIKNRDSEYTLVITNIKEMSERNQYSDKSPAQVFLIDYSYKNINSKDALYISDMNFKIIDEEGEIGDSYPNSTSKNPQRITSGTTCKAQMVLCVNSKSSNIKLQYYDNIFNDTPDAVFKIDL